MTTQNTPTRNTPGPCPTAPAPGPCDHPVAEQTPALSFSRPAPARARCRVRCRNCGRRFMRHNRPHTAAYCCRQCYLAAMRMRGQVMNCVHCGRTFFAERRNSARLPRFCSKRCYLDSRRPPINNCLRCRRPTTNNRFCSRACHGRWVAERSWDRYREHGLPSMVTCPACRRRRASAEFLLPDGTLMDRCATCRDQNRPLIAPPRPAAKLFPCRDCNRLTVNRLYCPDCLFRREHGPGDG